MIKTIATLLGFYYLMFLHLILMVLQLLGQLAFYGILNFKKTEDKNDGA